MMRKRRFSARFVGVLTVALAQPALADVEVVAVTPGLSAVLVIDGGAPIELDIGQHTKGVELVGSSRNGAVVRIDGAERELPLVAYDGGGSIADVGEAAPTVTLTSQGGHFVAEGYVNGSPVSFVVDTGATRTALSRAHAEAIGIDYGAGDPVQSLTANGIADGWAVTLESVEVGDLVVYDLEAVVLDNDSLPVGLLGMNFLDHFDMQRQGTKLVLRGR